MLKGAHYEGEFGGGATLLWAVLNLAEERILQILVTEGNILYKSLFYQDVAGGILSAGGTQQDIKKAEDAAMEAYMALKGKFIS